jgi:hypothetical protein
VHIYGVTGITIQIPESYINICYSENYSSIIFYILSLPTLAYTIDKGSTISISFFDVTKLQKNSLDAPSTGSVPLLMSVDIHVYIPYHPYGYRVALYHPPPLRLLEVHINVISPSPKFISAI